MRTRKPLRSGVRKYRLPSPLHANEGDVVFVCAVERLKERAQLEIAVIGVLPLLIVVVEKEGKTRATARLRVAQHREIAVGIAKSQDWASSDVKSDVLGLRCTGSGCSHQSVPSLSKVAMRSAGRTYSGPPSVVVLRTKSRMADFTAPSFQLTRGVFMSTSTKLPRAIRAQRQASFTGTEGI